MTLPRGPVFLFRKIAPTSEDMIGRERGQALLRVIVSIVATVYLAWVQWPFTSGLTYGMQFAFGYVTSAALFAGWVWRSRESQPLRRYAANLADVVAITVVMTAAGPKGAALVLLYLWVTIGSGFRYGLPALFVSLALSLGGYAIAAEQSGLVRQHPLLASSMWLILLVLPSYTAHLIRVLHTALAEVREASAAKSQFLARMSHELRTPLNGITGAVELIEASRRLTAEERTLLDVIRQSVGVSLRQINGVLDFSKLQAGKLVLERGPFDLHETLHTTVDIVRPLAKQKGLRLFVRIAPEMPYRLLGDAHHLREVLLNLLSNAVKFTEQGSVWLEASRVVNTADPTKMNVLFEVGDTGVGIAPDALERIFQPFVQEDETTTRRYGGTGLGTTIAKQLVELMGGRINVKSARGEGTVFRCEVPFEVDTDGSRQDVSLGGIRCLVVSPDRELHQRMKIALAQATVSAARTNDEASQVLLRGARVGNSVRVLLVDGRAAVSPEGQHWWRALCDKSADLQAFPILLTDAPVPTAQLRDWGYAAALARDAAPDELRLAVRAYAGKPQESTKIVRLDPVRDIRADARQRILVADDNNTNLMIVQRMLEHAGYEVEAVGSGDAALRVLESGRCRLAILDMHMPGLDGLGVIRRYRLSRGRARVPIIILTANVGFEAMRDSAEAGAEAYLAKPVTSASLLNEVERLLQQDTVSKLPPLTEEPESEPVIDEATLRELDRIYHDPAELSALIGVYEEECEAALAELARACAARNHPLFSEHLHALKGNAANVGARKLMSLCEETERKGVLPFMTEGTQLVKELRDSFAESMKGLYEFAAAAPGHKVREQ